MNKKSLVITIALIIISSIGIAAFTIAGKQQTQTENINYEAQPDNNAAGIVQTQEENGGNPTGNQTTTDNVNNGRYSEYSSEILQASAQNRRVLFFYANWCPTCRPADMDFKTNESKIPNDVTVIRVNYNDTDTDAEEKDLAKKYGVTYQHTYVQIDNNGNEVTKWNGGDTDTLISRIF